MPKTPEADRVAGPASEDRLTEAEARELASRAFERCGVARDPSAQAAAALTTAEMMGIATHGLNRVIDYTTRLRAGGMDATAKPEIEACAPALVRVDGRNALGPVTASRAVHAGLDAARAAGVGAVFVRRGAHLGALAPYLLTAAEQGFAALITSNTAPMVAPPGGRSAILGNMPLGLAVPYPGADPVLLDMALTTVSRSRIRAAAEAGDPIPEGWGLGSDGRATTDPNVALKGLIATIGGAKGASLALCLDLFAGVLSGARFLDDIPDTHKTPAARPGLGYMVIVFDCARLMPPEALAQRMAQARSKVAATPPIEPHQPVRMPGARALAALRIARSDGFCPNPETLARLRALAGD
jgi:LDH2 family malate/lactate/ureidoglycolate dehydrogenase